MAKPVDIKKRQVQALREEKRFREEFLKGIDAVFEVVFEKFVADYVCAVLAHKRKRKASQAAEPGSGTN